MQPRLSDCGIIVVVMLFALKDDNTTVSLTSAWFSLARSGHNSTVPLGSHTTLGPGYYDL